MVRRWRAGGDVSAPSCQSCGGELVECPRCGELACPFPGFVLGRRAGYEYEFQHLVSNGYPKRVAHMVYLDRETALSVLGA